VEKLVYLLFDDPERSGSALRDDLFEQAIPSLREAGAEQIVLHVQDDDVAAGQPMRRSDPPIRAMISFWMQCADERASCEAALAAAASRIAGYLVVESKPLVHEVAAGQRTAGMTQVTCIARKPDLTEDEFYDYWQNDHKRVAIETQSTTGYVRNVVQRAVTAGAPPWDAIVEETFPIEALTDPKAFYDARDDAELKANAERMLESCRRFLDFEPMEFTHMSEYYLG